MGLASALLKITGDSSDAREALSETARGLSEIGQKTVEATVDVNTKKAKRSVADIRKEIAQVGGITAEARVELQTAAVQEEIQRVTARLVTLSKQEATPKVDAQTARAAASLDRLELKLSRLEARRVEINVHADTNQVAGLAGVFGNLAAKVGLLPQASGDASRAVQGGLVPALGGMLGSINPAGLAMAGLVAVVGVAFAAAVAALVASAAAAVAAIGAIATAALAVAGPAILALIGFIRRFKAEADTAGTPANKLKKAFGGLGDVFDRVIGPAADRVFTALAAALPAVARLLSPLRPAFTALGDAIATVVGKLSDELGRPAWAAAIRTALATLTRIVQGPASDAFLSFARIFRDIAVASMPALESAARGVARALGSVADRTGDTDALSRTIDGLVGHLRSWLELTHQLGRVVLAFFKGAAPEGQGLVDTIAAGAERLADFLNTARGQNQLRQFFADVIPEVVAISKAVGEILVALFKVSQAAAPIITALVEGFLTAKDAVDTVRNATNSFLEKLGPLGAVLGDTLNPLTSVAERTKTLADIFSATQKVAGQAFDAIQSTVGSTLSRASSTVSGFANHLKATWDGIKTTAGTAWDGVKSAVTSPVEALASAVRRTLGLDGLRGYLGDLWSGIKAAATTAWDGVKSAITTPIEAAASAVKKTLGLDGLRKYLDDLWSGIETAATTAFTNIKTGATTLGTAIVKAITGALGKVPDVAKGVVNGVIDLLNRSIPNKIKVPGAPDINLPDNPIPRLAKGGIVRRSTFAQIGEGNHSEAVLPLSRAVFASLADGIVQAMSTALPPVKIAPDDLRALKGLRAPAAPGAGGGSYSPTYHFPPAPGGGMPDPEYVAAQLEALLRDRGVLAGLAT